MLDAVTEAARRSGGIEGKEAIAEVIDALAPGAESQDIRLGDDCAAIPNGDGWLLFAMEGLVNTLLAEAPRFAGYCGIAVNVSDVAAMGGRPTAVVNAFWSRDNAHAEPVLAGMAEASAQYGVPIVGGHSNTASNLEQLAVAIVGRAQRLITSFDARPGDTLMAAIDLRGGYREPWPNWDASSTADPARLQADMALLPSIAEAGLCQAGKDISMAGVVGTALMLLECSRAGGVIDIEAVPRPPETDPVRWLNETFPSYGFLLAVPPEHAEAVKRLFAQRDIACEAVGHCDDSHRLRLRQYNRETVVRHLGQSPLTGCAPRPDS